MISVPVYPYWVTFVTNWKGNAGTGITGNLIMIIIELLFACETIQTCLICKIKSKQTEKATPI